MTSIAKHPFSDFSLHYVCNVLTIICPGCLRPSLTLQSRTVAENTIKNPIMMCEVDHFQKKVLFIDQYEQNNNNVCLGSIGKGVRNEWCLRTLFCTVKAMLGRRQPWRMR